MLPTSNITTFSSTNHPGCSEPRRQRLFETPPMQRSSQGQWLGGSSGEQTQPNHTVTTKNNN